MEEFLRKLSGYIAKHPPVLHSGDVDTILDVLFWAYSESAGADSKAVLQYNEDLNCLLNDLCWEHERRGFINGFKLSMRLEQEVSQ